MSFSAIRTFVADNFALPLPGLPRRRRRRSTGQNWPRTLTIGTASPGGTYHSYGEGLARILTRDLGLPVSVRATQGPAENIALLGTGEIQIAFVTIGAAQQAWNATGAVWRSARARHAGPLPDVRHGLSLRRSRGVRHPLAGRPFGQADRRRPAPGNRRHVYAIGVQGAEDRSGAHLRRLAGPDAPVRTA